MEAKVFGILEANRFWAPHRPLMKTSIFNLLLLRSFVIISSSLPYPRGLKEWMPSQCHRGQASLPRHHHLAPLLNPPPPPPPAPTPKATVERNHPPKLSRKKITNPAAANKATAAAVPPPAAPPPAAAARN